MASASYSLPQKILDEMIVDEEPTILVTEDQLQERLQDPNIVVFPEIVIHRRRRRG